MDTITDHTKHIYSLSGNKPANAGGGESYKRPVLIMIFFLSMFRGILAFLLELGNDEAYYWLYSLHLQWNYFDHPPLVAVWIRLFTVNLALDHLEGFVRLGSVIGAAISSWFIYRAVSLIHSERSGWYAAILYNASFYAGITAGLYILPDSPQMVCWTFCMLIVAKLMASPGSWKLWILFGLGAGLCIMSKVHGGFLWIGLGAWILFLKRSWLKKPQVYLAVIITAALISPILIWNIRYDFATWNYHSQRVDVDEFIINWKSFGKQLASQIGFNNPVNVFLVISALVAWKRKLVKQHDALEVYLLTGLPLAVILLLVSFFRDTALPHWSGPAYVSLIPLAAIYVAETKKTLVPGMIRASLAVFLLVYTAWAMAVQFYPGTYIKDEQNLGRGDVTADMFGWREAGRKFGELYKEDLAQGIMPEGAAMVTSHWWGAHVEYYFCRPLNMTMIGLGSAKPGHYLWLNKQRSLGVDMQQVYCVVPSTDRYRVPFDFFNKAELARVIDISRNGRPAHRFYVYRLRGLKKEIPFH